MRILLADDSKATGLPIVAFLRERGHDVVFVYDGRAAVEAYREFRPDVVLLDVVMPEMDGIEATRRIKALGGARWVPLLLMTALSDQKEIVAGLEAGADDYLIKPVSFEVLEARIRSMQRIATMQESLLGILDNVFEAILTIDELGIVQSYNLAAERIFGYEAKEVIGTNVKILMPSPYAEQHDGYLARYIKEGTPHVIGVGRTAQGRRKNGDIFPMHLSVTEVHRSPGRLFIGLVRDISAEEEARKHIEYMALHDALTGLPNRAHFNEALERLLQASEAQVHAVLFIDLDGFKPINDTLGHDAGDEALRIIAARLRHNLAANDFAARLGGDEFVALACNVGGPEAAERVGNRLIAAISEPLTLSGEPARLGASIGIALFQSREISATAVLSYADHAMYAAKRSGKGRIVLAAGIL